MSEIKSFRDLRVYQEMADLHIAVHNLTLTFPKFELFELGSQLRRSSNSAPAQIAEGWGSRHTNIYIEAINRALGEVRETQHHLDMGKRKGYLKADEYGPFDARYDICGQMLEKPHQSLTTWKGSVRTPAVVKEQRADYGNNEGSGLSVLGSGEEWEEVV